MRRRNTKRTAWEKAQAAGIDMSLVEMNLRKTVAERIRAHDRALNLGHALRKAVQRKHRDAGT